MFECYHKEYGSLKVLVLYPSELVSFPVRLFTYHSKKTASWSRPVCHQLSTTGKSQLPFFNSFSKSPLFELCWLSSDHMPAYWCNSDYGEWACGMQWSDRPGPDDAYSLGMKSASSESHGLKVWKEKFPKERGLLFVGWANESIHYSYYEFMCIKSLHFYLFVCFFVCLFVLRGERKKDSVTLVTQEIPLLRLWCPDSSLAVNLFLISLDSLLPFSVQPPPPTPKVFILPFPNLINVSQC